MFFFKQAIVSAPAECYSLESTSFAGYFIWRRCKQKQNCMLYVNWKILLKKIMFRPTSYESLHFYPGNFKSGMHTVFNLWRDSCPINPTARMLGSTFKYMPHKSNHKNSTFSWNYFRVYLASAYFTIMRFILCMVLGLYRYSFAEYDFVLIRTCPSGLGPFP